MPREERATEQRIPIPVPPPGSEIIDIVFNVARGRILREQPRIGIEGFEQELGPASSSPINILRFRGSRGERRGEREGSIPRTSWVTVRGQGEQPELVKIVYRGRRSREARPLEPREEHDQILAVYAPAPGTCPDDADYLLSVAWTKPQTGPESMTLDPAGYASDLEALLHGAPDTPTTRYRKYFATLNLRTHPDLIETLPDAELPRAMKDDRNQWIGWLVAILHDRVVNRARAYVKSPDVPWKDTVGAGIERITELSRIQLQVADEWFGGDATPFREAFEMFANGALRLQLPNLAWTTQPSSGYFFYFAEFALLAMDQDVDAARWGQLAPTLVRAQHVFARVYPPAKPNEATFSSYRACNYDPLQVYSASELAQLEIDYPYVTEKDLRLGAGANAAQYLPAVLA
jgi:hypothetical protein